MVPALALKSMSYEPNHAVTIMPDMQNSRDDRNIAIDRVGVRNVQYPIVLLDRANEKQHSIGNFTLTVDLPKHFKGTHMSRFLEVLNDHDREVSVRSIPTILEVLRSRLTAEQSNLDVDFTYFISKAAPVTGKAGLMGYQCRFEAVGGKINDLIMQIEVPVTTLCPCSKEISAYGAHNQRGYVKVRIRTTQMMWIEEVIEAIESRASAPLYPLLKRPDEKFVTELAYDNPRFVEDMVREVALAFDAEPRITWYSVEVENHESIHAHNAYAVVERTK
jgi:GTP cyclohydrolase I